MRRDFQPSDFRATNESIEDVLEACRARLAGGATIEDCLAAYPAHAVELETLLPLVVATEGLAEEPNPAYARAARRRFDAALDAANAARQLQPATSRGVLGFLRRLTVPVVAVLLMLALSGVGLVQAASSPDVLPDNPLYSVEQARENVSAALTRTPDARATLHVRLAQRRLAELQAAQRMRKPPVLLRLIATSMIVQTTQATEEVQALPADQRGQLATQLRSLIGEEQAALGQLSTTAPRFAPAIRQLQRELQSDLQQV